MSSKNFLSSKLAVIILIGFLIFFGNLKYKQWQGQRAIEKEKNTLFQQEQAQLRKNQELQQNLDYLKSPDFKERVARQQLNLKKEGEMVFTFSQNEGVAEGEDKQKSQGLTNPQKWWNYFFKPNS